MAQEVKQGHFLDHLTKGLYDAVVQAQALAQNQHIESLSKYVNDDGTPKGLHYTEGGPWFDDYKNCEYSSTWNKYYEMCSSR